MAEEVAEDGVVIETESERHLASGLDPWVEKKGGREGGRREERKVWGVGAGLTELEQQGSLSLLPCAGPRT